MKNRSKNAVFSGLLLLLVIVSHDAASRGRQPHFTRTPIIYKNANRSVPLAAIIEFSTDTPVRVTLLVDDDVSSRRLASWRSYTTEHSLPVLGLRPGMNSRFTITVSDALGNASQWTGLEFRTDALPSDFPAIDATVTDFARMEPGVTLFDPIKQGGVSYGLIVAVNERGEVIWYYRSNESISDARRLRNGNLLLLGVTGAVEIDMLGNVIQEWHSTGHGNLGDGSGTPVNTETFHHELYETVSKDFLVLSTELRRFGRYPSSEVNKAAPEAPANVVGDVVVEFKNNGTVVHTWSLLDILDPFRIGFGSLGTTRDVTYPEAAGGTEDWSHANAVIEDPSDDSLIVSVRHQDAVIKIDRAGRLIWILGTPDGWNSPWNRFLLTPVGDLQWQYHQHAPMITPSGTILMFDNGNFRHRPFDDLPRSDYSRAVEYAVDRARMTVSQVWSYGGPGDEFFFSNALGDANWMRTTGNVLVTDGSRTDSTNGLFARIVEVTHTKPAEKVFELIIKDKPESNTGWRVYRSERLPSLYPRELPNVDDQTSQGLRP